MSPPGGGFVINQIELMGFMRYKDPATVPFRNRFTVITGPTGSGKTSLLDAVTFALYGKSSRTDVKVKIDEFVDKNGYVKLRFSRGGHEYEVARGRRNGRNYLTLARGSQRIAGTTSDLEYKVENLVGLDYIGFRNSTFIRQDEMKQIGSESGAERLAIFERLFRLEIFEKAKDLADAKLRTVEVKLEGAKVELGQRQKEFTQVLPEERKRLAQATDTHSEHQQRIDDLKKKSGDAEKLVKKLEPIHFKYEKAARGIKETSEEIRRQKTELDKAVSRNREHQKLLDLSRKLRDSPAEQKKLDREREDLEKKGQQYQSLIGRREERQETADGLKRDAADEVSQLGKDLRREQERLGQLARTMSRDVAFDLLRQEGGLTERIARITKELDWLKDLLPGSFIETLSNEQKEARRQVVRVAAKTKKIDSGIFVRSEIEAGVRRMEVQLDRLKTRTKERVAAEEAAIKKIDEQITKVGFSQAQLSRFKEVKKRLAEIAGPVRQYEAAQRKLEKVQGQGPLIANLKSRIQRLRKRLSIFTAQENRLSPEEERYLEALKDQRSLGKSLADAAGELGRAEGEVGILKQRVKDLEELGPVISKMEEGLKGLESEKEVFAVLKQDVFHRKGLLLYAISQLLQGISIEASNILGELTDERLNKIRLTPSAEVRGGTVGIEVEGVDGLFRDVSGFSGGEKTQVNAALRFAISKELARMPQIGKSYGNMKTLFIDEGDLGSLDTENARVLFVRKLLSMGDMFERIVLITHIAEVAEQFPSRVRVYMTPEKYSRVDAGGAPA